MERNINKYVDQAKQMVKTNARCDLSGSELKGLLEDYEHNRESIDAVIDCVMNAYYFGLAVGKGL